MNKASVNIFAGFLWMYIFISLDKCQGVELLGHVVNEHLVF